MRKSKTNMFKYLHISGEKRFQGEREESLDRLKYCNPRKKAFSCIKKTIYTGINSTMGSDLMQIKITFKINIQQFNKKLL